MLQLLTLKSKQCRVKINWKIILAISNIIGNCQYKPYSQRLTFRRQTSTINDFHEKLCLFVATKTKSSDPRPIAENSPIEIVVNHGTPIWYNSSMLLFFFFYKSWFLTFKAFKEKDTLKANFLQYQALRQQYWTRKRILSSAIRQTVPRFRLLEFRGNFWHSIFKDFKGFSPFYRSAIPSIRT